MSQVRATLFEGVLKSSQICTFPAAYYDNAIGTVDTAPAGIA